MKKNQFILLGMILLFFVSCNTSVKVLSAWRSEDGHKMKERNILVIARTADSEVRADFETSIANKLRSKGYKATESFTRFPKMNPDKEMTEEREKFIKEILGYEGYDAVCINVLKEYSETKTNYYNDFYMGNMGMMGPYSTYYPSYYGGFYSYYTHPYSYSTFGNYYGSRLLIESMYWKLYFII